MKQGLQNLKTGITEVTDVPCPRAGRGQLLIRSSHTLVSAGTERMLVGYGKAGALAFHAGVTGTHNIKAA